MLGKREENHMKKNPTTIFIQLLRTKTIKKNKYSEKKHEKRRRKKNLTLIWLQVKLRRGKKNKFIKSIN
jgi:hypothetical protein